MNCSVLSFKICKEIEDYISISGYMQEEIMREREIDFTNSISKELDFEEYEKKMSEKINSLLNTLYQKSKEEGFIFFDAPLSVYKVYIKNAHKAYFKINIDATEIEFYKDELMLLNQPEKQRVLIDEYGYKVDYHYLLKYKRNFEISLKRKKEFINSKINSYSNNLINTAQKPIEDYNKEIFISKEAEDWYNHTLNELNALDENKKATNKFSAKANSIYKVAKNNIFNFELSLKKYIEFLNEVYSLNQKYYDKLSDGKNYDNKVNELFDSYLNS